jgi:hypothetical protein
VNRHCIALGADLLQPQGAQLQHRAAASRAPQSKELYLYSGICACFFSAVSGTLLGRRHSSQVQLQQQISHRDHTYCVPLQLHTVSLVFSSYLSPASGHTLVSLVLLVLPTSLFACCFCFCCLLQWPSLLRAVSPSMPDLPAMVQDKYCTCQTMCFCGVFPEIRRAWASVDNSLFLWRYDRRWGILLAVAVAVAGRRSRRCGGPQQQFSSSCGAGC